MVKRFIHKKVKDSFFPKRSNFMNNTNVKTNECDNLNINTCFEKVAEDENYENKEEIKEDNVMDTKEKIQMANAILNAEQPKVKKVKKDKGLIERTESSITILTEDNRELLKD